MATLEDLEKRIKKLEDADIEEIKKKYINAAADIVPKFVGDHFTDIKKQISELQLDLLNNKLELQKNNTQLQNLVDTVKQDKVINAIDALYKSIDTFRMKYNMFVRNHFKLGTKEQYQFYFNEDNEKNIKAISGELKKSKSFKL